MAKMRMSRLRLSLKRFFNKLFRKKKRLSLGIYGPTNSGKTTLANRITLDWVGEELGTVSNIPHETRTIQKKENVVIESEDGRKLVINLIDTPGIATKIDYEDFEKFGIKGKKAKERAKEATQGIIEAIKWLDKMDVVLAVMDSTKSPFNQVNLTILGNLEARKIPVIIVANKIDMKSADVEKIKKAFPQYVVVGVSAKKNMNIDKLYKKMFEVTK
jgi:GTP-binding protein Era